jgi:predicted phosphoribosyltransferase
VYDVPRFRDRWEAGRVLADALTPYVNAPDVLVLGLPRGGVPVAYEVARGLRAPLDVFVVRKLGVPGHEELAMGAVASGGARVVNEDVVDALGLPPQVIDGAAEREMAEVARRERVYRAGRPPADVAGRTAILVDDGLATGSTMRAAVAAVRGRGPRRVVVAVPVAAAETCAVLRKVADDVVAVATPEPFYAIGCWYQDFSQLTDADVRAILDRATCEPLSGGGA